MAATPEPVAEPEPEVVPEADEGTDLDEERPRRRWFGVRRAKAEPEEPPEDTGELAVPEPPKHVRKLEAGEAAPADEPAEARAGVDAAEDR